MLPLRRLCESRSIIEIIAKLVGAGARSRGTGILHVIRGSEADAQALRGSFFPGSGVSEGGEGVQAKEKPLKLSIVGPQALVSRLRTHLGGTQERLSFTKLYLVGIQEQVINARSHLSSSRTDIGDPRAFVVISGALQKVRKSLLVGMHARITGAQTLLAHVHAAIPSMKSSLASL